jgi:hypothetical protein
VCPRAVRVIIPIVMPPMTPIVSAWIASGAGTMSHTESARSSRYTTIHA